ncbi:unnamed protein product [Cuscuta epithymum]|uniref:Uncharacterized protein n=1 Tax=Cuscuta epithymum TaxID=186058 RepID=A0AAV0FG41_9ASTE|nr:unnamed protein product [Cuscuta epithymum]
MLPSIDLPFTGEATSQFQVGPEGCCHRPLVSGRSRREDVVRASSVPVLKTFKLMLMDIIFLNNYLGACMPMFAKCGMNTCIKCFRCLNECFTLCLFMDVLCVNDIADALYSMDVLDCG